MTIRKTGSLAQLNRAFDYGSKGYRFESCAGHNDFGGPAAKPQDRFVRRSLKKKARFLFQTPSNKTKRASPLARPRNRWVQDLFAQRIFRECESILCGYKTSAHKKDA